MNRFLVSSFFLTAVTAALSAADPIPQNPALSASDPTVECVAIPGPKSACGLPSKVVIDMSKNPVRHTDAEWRKLLTPTQYEVSRKQGTEEAFHNEYWDNHRDGVYFSVCSDTPLFDSRDKFDSGTGWPSFTRPIDFHFIAVSTDDSFGMTRDEVHCTADGAHLGHVFDDGPRPTRKRYCINSASLRFMPRKEYNAWVAAHSVTMVKVGKPAS